MEEDCLLPLSTTRPTLRIGPILSIQSRVQLLLNPIPPLLCNPIPFLAFFPMRCVHKLTTEAIKFVYVGKTKLFPLAENEISVVSISPDEAVHTPDVNYPVLRFLNADSINILGRVIAIDFRPPRVQMTKIFLPRLAQEFSRAPSPILQGFVREMLLGGERKSMFCGAEAVLYTGLGVNEGSDGHGIVISLWTASFRIGGTWCSTLTLSGFPGGGVAFGRRAVGRRRGSESGDGDGVEHGQCRQLLALSW